METTYTAPDGRVFDVSGEFDWLERGDHRALDCEISQRLGWTQIRRRGTYSSSFGFWSGVPLKDAYTASDDSEFHDPTVAEIPYYTSEMAAALSLFNGFDVILKSSYDTANRVWAVERIGDDSRPPFAASALATALCLVWLSADDKHRGGIITDVLPTPRA